MSAEAMPLLVRVPRSGEVQPVSVGVPCPRGWLRGPEGVTLRDATGQAVSVQTSALARWGDASIQWLLIDFLLPADVTGEQRWSLRREMPPAVPPAPMPEAHLDPNRVRFHVQHRVSGVDPSILIWSETSPARALEIDDLSIEQVGPVRTTERVEWRPGLVSLLTRHCFFAEPRLSRLRLTVHNPRRAVHRGGLWDLGDPGSVRGLHLRLVFPRAGLSVVVAEHQPQRLPPIGHTDERLEIGLLEDEELQGGEQKTFTVWFWMGEAALVWVDEPAQVQADPGWVSACGVLPFFPSPPVADERLTSLLSTAIEGPNSLFARREQGQEYGWRNFGEVHADHENAHYRGPKPIVSHYNNQYDMVLGFLQQYLSTADERWWRLGDPLARHVADIDIYHTREDRAAFSGGMFWHTDHYRDAGTATHRAYSKVNAAPGQPYGGGPSNEHSYTTGLLLYYHLSGDPQVQAAVREAADWMIATDDGRLTLWCVLDDGPTGWASQTKTADYHGPGRGAGNAINTLLNAWLLDHERKYLDKAEQLIRRCVGPNDEVAGRDLLDIENRWSYTVFLTALVRYLDLKREYNQPDAMYAYARLSLLRYAEWMATHERPYLDRPETLEFVTETWAAQELRKANVLRLAARFTPAGGPLHQRGLELAERAWRDLMTFETRICARPLAIMLIEGPRDVFLRVPGQETVPEELPPAAPAETDFVPQRRRVRQALRSPRTWLRAAVNLVNVTRWPHYLRLWRQGAI